MRNRRTVLACLTALCALLFVLLFLEDREEYTELVFSVESGFYEEPFTLVLSAPVGTEIYYTLDGSEPDEHAMKYTEPIQIEDATKNDNRYSLRTDVTTGYMSELIGVHNPDLQPPGYVLPDYPIDKCTVVRAVYVDKEGALSEIKTGNYFVGFDEKKGYDGFNIISVVTDPDNLFDYDTGIYVLGRTHDETFDEAMSQRHWWQWNANYHQRGHEWERAANIQIFNAERELIVSQNCGIRIQGGGSRGRLPRSMSLYAREKYDANGRFYTDLFGTGYRADTVTLFAGGDDYSAKLRDKLVSELVKDRNFAVMNYEPYVMFLDGEYWGIYWMTEKYDSVFLGHRYDVEKDDVIMIKNGQIAEGTEEDFALYLEMRDYIAGTDFSVPGNYEEACGVIDMQSFIDYYAVEIYIARGGDWPTGNFALWRTRRDGGDGYRDGKWRWMLYDVNSMSLSESIIQMDTLSNTRALDYMFDSLCRSGEFRKQFTLTLMDLANTCFSTESIEAYIGNAVGLMAEPMKAHNQRFFGSEKEEEFLNAAADIQIFLENRKPYIARYLKEDFGLTGSLAQVEIEINDADAGSVTVNTAKIPFLDKTVWHGEYFTDYPIVLTAQAEAGYRFAGWEKNGELISEEESIVIDFEEEEISRRAVFEEWN